ncbi:hypothetical protein TMEC54S_02149 [Thauera mechernichensis]
MTAELLKVHEVKFEAWARCTVWLRAFDDGSALFETYDRDYMHGELERVDYYQFEPASAQAMAVALGIEPGGADAAARVCDALLERSGGNWFELMKLVSAAGATFVHTTDPWP